jgi:hypothetical protein
METARRGLAVGDIRRAGHAGPGYFAAVGSGAGLSDSELR